MANHWRWFSYWSGIINVMIEDQGHNTGVGRDGCRKRVARYFCVIYFPWKADGNASSSRVRKNARFFRTRIAPVVDDALDRKRKRTLGKLPTGERYTLVHYATRTRQIPEHTPKYHSNIHIICTYEHYAISSSYEGKCSLLLLYSKILQIFPLMFNFRKWVKRLSITYDTMD